MNMKLFELLKNAGRDRARLRARKINVNGEKPGDDEFWDALSKLAEYPVDDGKATPEGVSVARPGTPEFEPIGVLADRIEDLFQSTLDRPGYDNSTALQALMYLTGKGLANVYGVAACAVLGTTVMGTIHDNIHYVLDQEPDDADEEPKIRQGWTR